MDDHMEISFSKLEYDPGDKRSSGSLDVVAETPKGKFRVSAFLSSSGELEFDDDSHGVFLDDVAVDFDVSFDPGLAHYYGGRKAVDRCQSNLEEWVREAIEECLNES